MGQILFKILLVPKTIGKVFRILIEQTWNLTVKGGYKGIYNGAKNFGRGSLVYGFPFGLFVGSVIGRK